MANRSESNTALQEALGEGDPQKVVALIEAGADIHYKREHGYDSLLDAVHGHDISRDPRLIDLLTVLVNHGVNLRGVSTYGESALRALSRIGRFDAVQLLLKAGADKSHLKWTPLIEAVALRSLADVKAILERGTALEERDCWSRTAWLISLLTGDIAKAKLLLERGADRNARGHFGYPPLFYAIHGHQPDMLRWLLQHGADVHQTNDFGSTALMQAVEHDDLECVEILLKAGADLEADANGTALGSAESREIILRLLDAGADPANLTHVGHRAVLNLPAILDATRSAVSSDELQREITRTFGTGNPEKMNEPFWLSMIRCGISAYEARCRFGAESHAGPVWCAQRFGQSLTILPDGRMVQIGGEHEDFYDPDFCIYNDVFVHDPDGSITIFGYPEAVFPPTDFHTATLIGDFIYVIGTLGYQGTRRFGETPVYRLNTHTFQMERLIAVGEAPGWIYKHRAAAILPHEIRVWGGTIVGSSTIEESNNPDCGRSVLEIEGPHENNPGAFVLDLDQLIWRRA